MELVQGVPITEYCDQCSLTTRERLELFITVCQAVQHAHQKGIIHRDIKPTNVLVAMQDGRPTPKIIDFGVAKAIGERLTEHTVTTAFAQMIGSPLYMSPEQAELSPLGVDTRSDIYSLGVMLYELLAGTTPFDKDRLRSVNYDELRRIIREEEPPRPSARISTLAADLATTVADQRRTDVRRLRQTIRSELDWIVMKAIDKDRNRRNETPSSLARDIERYLHDEPVQACPPSAGYRFRKFARRNKTLLAAGSAIAAALMIGLGLSSWMYVRERAAVQAATTEGARAHAVSSLLQEMLGSADAANAKGADYKVRELLDDFSADLGSQLTGQPEVEADIHATVGRAYRSLKLPEKGQPHFQKAIELQRQMRAPQSEQLAAILVDYAWNLQDQQKYAEAESQIDEALKIYRQCRVAGGPLVHALGILQHVLINAGRDEDAERVTKHALEVARQSGQEFADQAILLHRYAGLKIRQGHFAEAERLAFQSVDMHRRLHGEHHPETAFGLKTLANALVPKQKLAEAEAAVREALKVFRRQFPEGHPNVRGTIDQLRTVLKARGDKSALEALTKEESDYAMRSGSPDYHIQLGELLTNTSALAIGPEDFLRSSLDSARADEAHRQIRQAIEGYGRVAIEYPDDLNRRVKALAGYARAIWPCAVMPGFEGEVEELSRRLESELPQLLTAFPDSRECQWQTAMIYISWGGGLWDSRTCTFPPPAVRAVRQAAEILEKLSLVDPTRAGVWPYLAFTHAIVGDYQWRAAKLAESEAAFRRAMEIYEQHAAELAADPTHNADLVTAMGFARVAYFLATNQREDEATAFARRAALHAGRLTEPFESSIALDYAAVMQLRLRDEAGYRETCQALVDVPVASADDRTKVRAILALCYGPDALKDLNLPVKRAEELVADNSLPSRHIVPFVLGTALYRARQYERAADELKASIEVYPSNPPLGFATINSQRLWLAMTYWQQGKKDDARRLLAETQPAIDQESLSPPATAPYRILLEVLRREAEALIESDKADEAVENANHK
jgi:tetratricopeptide (TPR) repeat protein